MNLPSWRHGDHNGETRTRIPHWLKPPGETQCHEPRGIKSIR